MSDYQAYYPVSLGQATAASRAVLGEMGVGLMGNKVLSQQFFRLLSQ